MFWGRRGMHAHAGGEVQHSGKDMRRMWMTGCAMCTAVYGALALADFESPCRMCTGPKSTVQPFTAGSAVNIVSMLVFHRISFDRFTNSGTRSRTRIFVH
jgi:hypothetical protein